VRALRTLLCVFIFNLSVNACFGLVGNPFTDEEFVFIMVEITALALPQVVNPVTFKVVAVSLGKDAIAISLCLVPLALVDVLIGVYHAAFSLWHSIHPIAIVTIVVLVKKCATAMFLVFKPVTRILTT
jgi:hypothetical protein